ncbi:hypothetical protein NNC19_23155, partial [Clostridium sp. SHJSY1]|uniref:hypothetical protein n=1 Tax=Clostridium sp. SHJSY1 TaxID=2942483 RepID=UPI002875DD0B
QMKKKLILMSALIIALSSFTGCGSSTSTTEKKIEEKLPLTKENLKSVFLDYEYNVVAEIDEEDKSIDAEFIKNNDVERGKEKEELDKIEMILHERFDIREDDTNNTIRCVYDGRTIVKRHWSKIQIGEIPYILVKKVDGVVPCIKYKLNSEFNMLSPYGGLVISASDKEDGDISDKIKVKNLEILKELGKNKKLIYEVTDSDGNTRTEEFDVDVIN